MGEAAGTAGALSVMMKMEVPSCGGVPGKAAVVPLLCIAECFTGLAFTEIHLSVSHQRGADMNAIKKISSGLIRVGIWFFCPWQ